MARYLKLGKKVGARRIRGNTNNRLHHPDKLAALSRLIAELPIYCSDRITWTMRGTNR